MNTVDILISIGLLFAVWRGYRKGMLASFFKLLGYLLGLLTAVLFGEVLAKVLDRSLDVTTKMMPWLRKNTSLPASAAETRIQDIPFDRAQDLVGELPLPEVFQESLTEYLSEIAMLPETQGVNTLGEALMYMLANFILMGVCFFILYFIVSHFLGATIPRWLKKTTPGPVNLIDHLGGAGLGLLSGLISVGITVAMLIPVAAAGAVQGPGSNSLMAKLAVMLQDSILVARISEVVISLIT